MGLLLLCSCLKTKESYDRWITRRIWGFRHQISKVKYLKKCRSQILRSFRRISQPCKRAVKFRSKKDTISQPKADFVAVRNLPLAWSDRIPMAVTPSFQLWIAYHLKHWIANFLSLEMTYSMHKLNSTKCSKSGWQWLSSGMLHGKFLFASPPCIPDLLMAKDFKASNIWFFMFLSFSLLCHGCQRTLLKLGLLWWSIYLQKHQNLHNLIRNDCKGP